MRVLRVCHVSTRLIDFGLFRLTGHFCRLGLFAFQIHTDCLIDRLFRPFRVLPFVLLICSSILVICFVPSTFLSEDWGYLLMSMSLSSLVWLSLSAAVSRIIGSV
jgi:hypothetical protein